MKKILLSLVALVIVLAVAAGIWLYSSLDSLVLAAIEKYGPEMTQTTVKVARVKISPTDGSGAIGGLRIGNPKGFKTDHAVNAGSIELGVDLGSLTRDVIVIRRIAVLAPDINYETSDAGSNFDVIQKNVQDYVSHTAGKSDPAAKDKQPAKKLIVDALSIRDAKVSYAPALLQGKSITLSLPNIELRNIGRAKGGITSGELASEIVGVLKGQLVHAVSQSVKGVAEAVGNAAQGVGDKVKGLFK
jgi:uncharacterized protein involved in outer membrane biogenesis